MLKKRNPSLNRHLAVFGGLAGLPLRQSGLVPVEERLEGSRVAPETKRRLGVRADSQSQRDCASKPRVGAQRLPWEWGGWFSQPQRGCGPDTTRGPIGSNPVGVDVRRRPIPRIAPWAQPWTGGQNPVGIRDANRSSRMVLGLFAADSCKTQPAPTQPYSAKKRLTISYRIQNHVKSIYE